MTEPFDPYRKWLGIPLKDQPPNHYRLLGIAHFEDDPDVIENAATRQMAHVRTFQSGKHSSLSQKILNELTAAKLCLLQSEKKASYDVKLRVKLAAEGKLSSSNLLAPSELMDEPPADEDPPREELPEVRRTSSARWKTDADDPLPAEPPIVPIPMPRGTAVAAPPRLSPSIPHAPSPLMVSGPSRSTYRSKKSASASLPIAIAIIGLLIIFGGGIVAAVLSGAFSKPAEKTPKKSSATSTSFPLGTAAKEKDSKDSFKFNSTPTEPALAEPAQPAPPKKAPRDRGMVEDELRQALFLGRQALEKRDADMCKSHVVTAENLLDGHPEVDSKLKEQVQLLRLLLNMNGEFWSLARDAAINGKVASGEKLKYRKQEFQLVSHEGELVTYKMGEKEQTSPLMEMDPRMALALVRRSTQEDHGKRLTMLAFGMVDKPASEENFDRGWVKSEYTRLALEGHTNATLARELGVDEKPDPATTKVPEGDEDETSKDGQF
ncbi:MAG: hypothetical protein IAF94_16390 [Pirellulaceae bacterium]|nr:hypothetical protein [Pirellulaceae bacterium]